jgi:hypothetical protein
VARLEPEYSEDSDGNAIPDFLERELGFDPQVDDCAREAACPGLAEVGDNPLLLEQNVLLILDSSGSMAGPDGAGQVKIDAARSALERYVVGTPDTYDLGLMVYGHRGTNEPSGKAESCAGIDVFAPLGELSPDSVPGVLAQFSPTGYTPLAASLDRAAEVFAGREGQANRIVMVTDGVETCDGDAVAAAQRLAQAEIGVTVDVVGFDVADSAQEQALRQVAEITGGTYTTARNAQELNDYFSSLVARQVSVVNALACVLVSRTSVEVCALRQESAAERALTQEAIESGDPQRTALLQELSDRISARTTAYREQLREASAPRIQELEAALEEARQRYQQRYGQDIAVRPCPLLGGPHLLM